jgi:hypothetical protein
MELTHCCPAAQDVPQVPQLAALVARSAQTPPQSVVPLGQAQAPLEQMRLPAQSSEQKPQLFLSVRRSTHELLHLARPDPHVIEQVPVLHTEPPMQAVPQLPQSMALVWRLTHVRRPMKPVHAVSPAGQAQVPPVHVPPVGHALPQAPQSALLVWRFTQAMPPMPMPMPAAQAVSPVGQPMVHVPFTHVSPPGQRVPQDPQLRGSVPVLVHAPSQLVSPPPHTQAPLVQLPPVPHWVPHAPQSRGSVVRSTHALLQFVSPAPQVVVQAPDEQTWPVAQTTPHAPQLPGSPWVLVQTPLQRVPML